MKLRVEIDGEDYLLDLQRKNTDASYTFSGALSASGDASVVEVQPGVFSVLLNNRSLTVHLVENGESLTVADKTRQHAVVVADSRDRSSSSRRSAVSGPMEIRAQMPGKVIAILVEKGSVVTAGQGLLIVEAMKMQNEVKSPKDGIVAHIDAREGSTVIAGEKLMLVE